MGELVPLRRVYFRGNEVRYADVPRDSRDLRWKACPQHHLACDCREAEHAEELQEFHGEFRYIRQIFDEVLKGHATDGPNDFDRCSCTGCEIARRTYLRTWFKVDDERRDVLGETARLLRPRRSDYGEVPF